MAPPQPPVCESDEVTPEWLGAALGRPGELGGFTATTIGTGQVGANVRYELSWNPPIVGAEPNGRPRPATVVGKFPSTDEVSRRTGGETESYVREVGFYRELQERARIRTPRIHYLAEDRAANAFVLIMEDVLGARPGDQLAGCDPVQARLAVEALAGLHGPFWGDPDLGEVAWLPRRDPDAVARRRTLFDAVWPGFVARYCDRIPSDLIELGAWLGDRLEAYLGASRSPLTLVHGDYRLDNMLFGAGSAPPLTVVDWQTCAIGSGPADAAYFVGAGLLPGVRRDAERSLFDAYAAALAAYIPDVDRQALWFDYRLGSASGYLMAVIASQIVVQTERGDEMFVAMATRHGHQMLDLDLAGAVEEVGR